MLWGKRKKKGDDFKHLERNLKIRDRDIVNSRKYWEFHKVPHFCEGYGVSYMVGNDAKRP